MAIFFVILFTIMFGLMSYSCFWQALQAFKTKRADDFDPMEMDFDIFSLPLILIGILLWICKKSFSEKTYWMIFNLTTFFAGLIFLIVIALIWMVVLLRSL